MSGPGYGLPFLLMASLGYRRVVIKDFGLIMFKDWAEFLGFMLSGAVVPSLAIRGDTIGVSFSSLARPLI